MSFLGILGSFLKVNVPHGGYFLELVKFQIFLGGCLKFLIFFWVNGRFWARADVRRKNESTSHGPPFRPFLFIDIYLMVL